MNEDVWTWGAVIVGLILFAVYWHSTIRHDPPPPTFHYAQQIGGGNGYAVRCSDGWMSHSGGIQGACSSHGGEAP
jgi:hypothetical protein